jgi:hypothetical protein
VKFPIVCDFEDIMSTVNRIWEALANLNTTPITKSIEHSKWLQHEDSISFLLKTRVGILPIYIASGNFFVYSIIVPESSLVDNYIDDLLSWNLLVSQGWGYGYYHDSDEKFHKKIYHPLDDTGTTLLNGREPIIYYRNFEGFDSDNEVYLELNQIISHIMGTHWSNTRNAYCKLDELGDIKEVVSISKTKAGLLSLADFEELELYLYLTDSAIVRVFDVTRFKGVSWSQEQSRKKVIHFSDANTELHAQLVIQGNIQSYLRGFQVIRKITSDETMMQIARGHRRKTKVFATYITLDWKHKAVRECSCAPDQIASYFDKSDLPFQLSPAFFRPEVLLKYKQHPDKFHLHDFEITCRGTWSLRYEINAEGQVHVYLCDIASLPHEEQLYWKSFNEEPKAGISNRAYKTDFLGDWDLEYDPLSSLKERLQDFPLANQFGLDQPIWSIPDNFTFR